MFASAYWLVCPYRKKEAKDTAQRRTHSQTESFLEPRGLLKISLSTVAIADLCVERFDRSSEFSDGGGQSYSRHHQQRRHHRHPIRRRSPTIVERCLSYQTLIRGASPSFFLFVAFWTLVSTSQDGVDTILTMYTRSAHHFAEDKISQSVLFIY